MDRRVARTKDAIRKAYLDLINTKDSDKISVAEIARMANIDRKTFYLHYESPKDILIELLKEKVDELLEALHKTEFFEEPIRLDLLFTCIQNLLEEDQDTFRKLAIYSENDYFWNRIRQIAENAIVSVYESQVTVSKAELQVYARFFCSGLLSLYLGWLNGNLDADLETIGMAIVKLGQNGIAGIFK